jgi:predicted outer membrane repeat protein
MQVHFAQHAGGSIEYSFSLNQHKDKRLLKNIFHPSLFIAVALLMLIPLTVSPALASPSAVTFTVDSVLDQIDDDTSDGVCHSAANHCTLRAAIMQANVITGPGVTIILPSGTYTLTRPPAGADGADSGDLNLTTPGSGSPTITITGAGAGVTIIDANQIDRVFHVHPNRVAAISDVTIRDGYLAGANAAGGGIYNEGSLTVSRAAISSNHVGVGQGGGINNAPLASLTLVNSTLSQNSSDYFGGAIDNSGNLDLRNSTLSQNTARTVGGAISSSGTLKISNSTIVGNSSDDGGGIYTGTGTLYVINSTISQNYANTNGGGILKYGTSGLVALYNTTIIDNDADHDRDQLGGIGGGVYSGAGARFIVVNTLITGNTILNAPIDDDCNGTLEVYGLNLLGEATGCAFSGNGTASRGFIALNTIGPLQNNGGPTWTHALLAGSAAIDATFDNLGCVNEVGALLTTDQRGAPRPVGARCDVGAFEFSPPRYLFLPFILR